MKLRLLILILVVLVSSSPTLARAQRNDPAVAAEVVRSVLLDAQLHLGSDLGLAQQELATAQDAYQANLQASLQADATAADQQVAAGFAAAAQALAATDLPAFAAARATIWTGLLAGGTQLVERSLSRGDAAMAREWLRVREFRHATRFSRPNANATLAINGTLAGSVSNDAALQAVRADLLDTYQARLNEALAATLNADRQNYSSRRAENAALAEGYFAILRPSYAEQRGPDQLAQAVAAFAALREAALSGQGVAEAVTSVETMLAGFRAAPLSQADQVRRAGQLLRFLSLVPVEYGRGVRNGQVAVDLEIREAITFGEGAAAAFSDLRSLLEQRDAAATSEVANGFTTLQQALAATAAGTQVAAPDAISGQVEQLHTQLTALMPPEWQKQDASADFDVIQTALDQMEQAAKAGQYALAESARLEAYAILESGPEARLTAFAPQYVLPIEDLFWYGQGDSKGLAYLIEQQAPAETITASRKALDIQLGKAQTAIGGESAPLAVASNAALIVFREGMEAVLILASLLGSLKIGTQRRLRAPLWWGAAGALLATVLTWLLARGALTAMARYGERLEAVVSLVAVGMLLLIMNWFFHDVYWKGWMANFHQQKQRLVKGNAGQWVGLAVLGFTSIYREGFETVLFLQALVLSAGTATVLGGVAIGFVGTLLLGVAVFALQAKLPHKKMLVVTGVLIGFVLLQLVGNTAHTFQVVGWLPTTPIRGIELPYWVGMWFGLYMTVEGLILQAAAATFTIGSYFLAEYVHKREVRIAMARQSAS
jgi:high-affinity iron transporter